MKCITCGKTPAMGATLLRQNEKGVAGVWACEAHSKPAPDDVAQVVAEIQQPEREAYYESGGLHPCYD